MAKKSNKEISDSKRSKWQTKAAERKRIANERHEERLFITRIKTKKAEA
ncbi:hypothetical protein [Solibacillus ferritrahens]